MTYDPSRITTPDLSSLFLSPEDSIREVLEGLDHTKRGIALVVDSEQCLLGTITEGDMRRAILARVDLNEPARLLLKRKKGTRWETPVTAPVGISPTDLLQLMREERLRHIPLVDRQGRVMDLVRLDDLVPEEILPLQAVVMAGGFGTRLRPLTEDLPKPMLPMKGRPLMERIIKQLREAGIRQVNVTTHHKPEKIIDYFGDGRSLGVELNYVNEDRPLGTVGALGLMKAPQEPVLVINGDILTQMNFRAMLAYHQEHKADLTVAVRKYDLNVPYGVVENDGAFVQGLVEKPSLSFFINAGIYLLEPSVYRYIPHGQHFDMTDLIQRLLEEKRPVVSFPIVEYWLDIGRPGDYEQAQEDVESGRI